MTKENHKNANRVKESDESVVLHRMAAFCSTKEYCIRDIRKKIITSGLTEEECERVINRLSEEKFIDEERYVKAYVKDKLRFAKWGRVKIRHELRGKEIPLSTIDAALEAIDEPAYTSTLTAILTQKKKSTKGKTPHEVYQKLFRFAAGRGFESRLIAFCLKKILNTDRDEDFFE